MKGHGEQKLQRAIRQMHRPKWLTTRMADLGLREEALVRALQFYQLQKVKQGANAGLEIHNAIQDVTEELQEIREERQALLLGYQLLQDTAEHAEL